MRHARRRKPQRRQKKLNACFDFLGHVVAAGSAISNGRETKSCLGQVFISKLGTFASQQNLSTACTQPLLKLKTQTRFYPVSFRLTMVAHNMAPFIGLVRVFVVGKHACKCICLGSLADAINITIVPIYCLKRRAGKLTERTLKLFGSSFQL